MACTNLWGLDLSGTLQGSGGIGGLQIQTVKGAGTQYICTDGIGNNVAIIDGATNTIVAEYSYDPFGACIKASGKRSKTNHLRFASQYDDEDTGFVYMKSRYLSTNTGRWISRDPISGKLGANYRNVENDPLRYIDPLGLDVDFYPSTNANEQTVKEAQALFDQLVKSTDKKVRAAVEEMKNDHSHVCSIRLQVNTFVNVGNYTYSIIDMGDINRFPERGGVQTRESAFLHELSEQWEKTKNPNAKGLGVFLKYHKEAIEMETRITGWYRQDTSAFSTGPYTTYEWIFNKAIIKDLPDGTTTIERTKETKKETLIFNKDGTLNLQQ